LFIVINIIIELGLIKTRSLGSIIVWSLRFFSKHFFAGKNDYASK
jgi:hypothetical protein